MADVLVRRAGYLTPAFAPDLREMARTLRDQTMGLKFDTLVGTGLSGALVVPYLGRALRKHWGIVRKEGGGVHSGNTFEGSLGSRWIMVDDLIDTGRTVERVTEAVRVLADSADHVTEFAGFWGYDSLWGGWVLPVDLLYRDIHITP